MNQELRYKHYKAELLDFIESIGMDLKTVIKLLTNDNLFEDLEYFQHWDDAKEFCEKLLKENNG